MTEIALFQKDEDRLISLLVGVSLVRQWLLLFHPKTPTPLNCLFLKRRFGKSFNRQFTQPSLFKSCLVHAMSIQSQRLRIAQVPAETTHDNNRLIFISYLCASAAQCSSEKERTALSNHESFLLLTNAFFFPQLLPVSVSFRMFKVWIISRGWLLDKKG